jgi:large subunit ribosomal protein L16
MDQNISDKPIIKPLEGMGKGKGAVEYWAAVVKPGRIMFGWRSSFVSCKEALRLAAQKASKTKFVVARDFEA